MPFFRSSAGSSAGDIKPWPALTAPAGWLKCNGAAVSRTLYAALFNVIGTTYGAGDGSTTFNLPDYRGEFLRGLDDGRGVDSGRTIGTAQAADFASHTHSGSTDTHSGHTHAFSTGAGSSSSLSIAAGQNTTGGTANTNSSGAHSHALNINATGGTETRPRNVSALWIIKY